MAVDDEGKSPAFPEVRQVAADARALVRSALKGALATVHKATGHPYASLVLTATQPDGTPVFLAIIRFHPAITKQQSLQETTDRLCTQTAGYPI